MGDKTIPDSAEPRLESFYPPFVAGIDLPHQGVVDSYNPSQGSILIHPVLAQPYNLTVYHTVPIRSAPLNKTTPINEGQIVLLSRLELSH